MLSMLINKDRVKPFVNERHTLTQTDRRYPHRDTDAQNSFQAGRVSDWCQEKGKDMEGIK